MNLDRVTITGIDDKTDIVRVREIQKRYPFVEWGILMSAQRQGTRRYPSATWAQNNLDDSLSLSAHLCGGRVGNVIQNQQYSIMDAIPGFFRRIQLNYDFSRISNVNTAHKCLYSLMDYVYGEESNRSLIFQWTPNNVNALAPFIRHYPFQLLYDNSGGNGRAIDIYDILGSLAGAYTGFAGGINTDNVHTICEKIKSIKPLGEDYNYNNTWIDMESGVRTDDELDLDKVEKVLEICKAYVRENNSN